MRDVLVLLGHFDELVNYILSRPWVVFKNNTNIEFITSDDPIIVLEDGWYIPLSKNVLLRMSKREDEERVEKIDDENDVIEINRMMRENAQIFCVSSSKNNKDVFGE